MEPTGIEPATSWLQTRKRPDATGETKALTPTPSAVCTRVCTSEAENANADAGRDAQAGAADQGNKGEGIDQGDPLAKLAADLAKLSPADRARLAAMLATT